MKKIVFCRRRSQLSPVACRRARRAFERHGFCRGPRRLDAPLRPGAERLRRAVEDSGPAFVATAQRLAGRRDNLSPALCRQLARAGTTPPAAAPVAELLADLPTSTALTVEPRPEIVRTCSQVHRARARGGRELRLEWLRPDLVEELSGAARELDLLADALVDLERGLRSTAARDLVGQAHGTVLAEAELDCRAIGLLALAEGPVPQAVPLVEGAASSSTILALQSTGRDLDLYGAARAGDAGANGSRHLASRVALAWLRQALRGELLPRPPLKEHIGVAEGSRVILLAGAGQETDPACRDALGSYLEALLEEDLDHAFAAFSDLFEPADTDPEFRRAFRLAAPVAEECDPEARGHLSEQVFWHWRLAARARLEPLPAAHDLLQGLAHLDHTTRWIAAEHDAMAWAVEHLARQRQRELWRSWLDPAAWSRHLAPMGEAVTRLPGQLEAVASRLAEGGIEVEVKGLEGIVSGPGERRRQELGKLAVAAVVILALWQGAGEADTGTIDLEPIFLAGVAGYALGVFRHGR